jgi:NitT/TauT family transport system permease protein
VRTRIEAVALPLGVAALFVIVWDAAVVLSHTSIFPRPHQMLLGMVELARRGVLVRYVVASLFRVSAGFLLALAVGVPLGLLLGWFASAFRAFNPAIQVLRPISPIAWIPVAILWFGVSDLAPILPHLSREPLPDNDGDHVGGAEHTARPPARGA